MQAYGDFNVQFFSSKERSYRIKPLHLSEPVGGRSIVRRLRTIPTIFWLAQYDIFNFIVLWCCLQVCWAMLHSFLTVTHGHFQPLFEWLEILNCLTEAAMILWFPCNMPGKCYIMKAKETDLIYNDNNMCLAGMATSWTTIWFNDFYSFFFIYICAVVANKCRQMKC